MIADTEVGGEIYAVFFTHVRFVFHLDRLANSKKSTRRLHAVSYAARTVQTHDFKDGDEG
jgi:hypothetical protein